MSSLMSHEAPAAGLLLKKSQSRSSKKDVKSIHRCWLETFLRAKKNHKATETAWQIDTLCSSSVVHLAPFETVFAGELFNSLYKRPSLYALKPFGKAPVDAGCPSDVQMMGCIMSRCRLWSEIIATCFTANKRSRSTSKIWARYDLVCQKQHST